MLSLAVEMEQLEDGLRTMDAQAEQHRALEQDATQIKTDRALTGALIERLIDRIEAVSYTHLDVYKRQHHDLFFHDGADGNRLLHGGGKAYPHRRSAALHPDGLLQQE